MNEWEKYGSILFHYDLYPTQMIHLGKIKQIYAGSRCYALKETVMEDRQLERFLHLLRKLEKKGYRQHVPLIPTKYGEYVVRSESHVYYLMPWIENEPLTKEAAIEEKISGEMGKIHRLTAKTVPFSNEERDKAYLSMLKKWDMRRTIFEQFADEREQNKYMSPLELTFFTNYYDLKMFMNEAKSHLDAWYEKSKDLETFRIVLCHGRLSRKHVLIGRHSEPYILNFERASYDTPARDAALFFRYAFYYDLWDEKAFAKWLKAYESHFQLTEKERHLLLAYLLFPEFVIDVVERYKNNPKQFTELEYVQRFERRMMVMRKVRRLKNLLLKPL